MKQTNLIILLGLILFFACQSNKEKKVESFVEGSIDLGTIDFFFPDSLESPYVPLTVHEHERLQIKQIDRLKETLLEELAFGKSIFKNQAGELVTLYVLYGGESHMYLLSYDQEGKLQEALPVAYDDLVEYYSKMYARIEKSEIIVTEISFDFSGTAETSDTTRVTYIITPELKFVKQ